MNEIFLLIGKTALAFLVSGSIGFIAGLIARKIIKGKVSKADD